MRFKAKGNGCPAYQAGEEVRYFIDITDHSEGPCVLRLIGGKQSFSDLIDGHEEWEKCHSNWFTIDSCRWLEVNERDLPYLEKPEGEWEFRKPKTWDEFYLEGRTHVAMSNFTEDCILDGYGYRWCRPKLSPFEQWWANSWGDFEPANEEEAARAAWNAATEAKR